MHGWPAGLRIAVDNLLRNAAVHGRPPVRVALTCRDGWVRLEVADAGPGIPTDELDAVRERFARGRSVRGGGSGLGLAIVDQQARLHGGRLELGGNDAGGTSAVLELPVRP